MLSMNRYFDVAVDSNSFRCAEEEVNKNKYSFTATSKDVELCVSDKYNDGIATINCDNNGNVTMYVFLNPGMPSRVRFSVKDIDYSKAFVVEEDTYAYVIDFVQGNERDLIGMNIEVLNKYNGTRWTRTIDPDVEVKNFVYYTAFKAGK